MHRKRVSSCLSGLTVLTIVSLGPAFGAAILDGVPPSFGIEGHDLILTVHAEGAQIYECKAGDGGATAWAFREPIAALFADGKSVGHHSVGPNWDMIDGDGVKGSVSISEPAATPNDIPLLKLAVVEHRGQGMLKAATLVLRLNTHGGGLKGPCESVGALRSEAYSADYLFLK